MLRYAKLGNIKIGGSQNGLPQRYNKIFVTKAYKDSGENFVVHPKFENGVNELKVRLPFVIDLINTFDASPSNFVSICGYRYIVKGLSTGQVIAMPLQEKDMNDRFLPCINFGQLSDINFARFELSNRILLTLFVMDENGIDYLDGKNGVYMLKTNSKNTFYDTDNTFRLLNGMNADLLRLVNFTLELHAKVIKNAQGENEEISYARILPPSPSEIVKASELLRTQGHVLIPALSAMEQAIINSRADAVQNALNELGACSFFECERLDIQIERGEFEQQVSVSDKAKEERAKGKKADNGSSNAVKAKGAEKKSVAKMMIDGKEKTAEDEAIEEQTKALAVRFPKIKDTVIASLINNFGVDEAVVILETNPTLPQVIAEISKRNIPDVDNV
jgi:hypothetical protein